MPAPTMDPVWRTCMICEQAFIAEWGRGDTPLWMTGDVCFPCEDGITRTLREEAGPKS